MDAPDHVTLRHPRQIGVAAEDLAEDRIDPVEVRLGREGDEPLASAGVGAGEGHAEEPGGVALAVDLVADLPPRAAGAVAARVAGLDDEVGDDAVPPLPV